MLEPMLTVKDACAFLRVGKTAFYQWLSDSTTGLRRVATELPNGRLRFAPSALSGWARGRATR